MKNNKLHIAKGFFLLLLSIVIVASSAGVSYTSEVTKVAISKKDKKTDKEEKVSVAHGLEAVVVSILNPDFEQEVFFSFIDFSPAKENCINILKRVLFSEKHFHTLFTNIISPNAP